jgi:hypothetical protein
MGGWGLTRVAVLAMAFLATTSCLVTEDLQPYVPPDPPVNTWPRIIEASVSPKNSQPVVPSIDGFKCNELPLSLGTLADENPADDLYVRTFVDGEIKDQAFIVSTDNVERIGYTFTFLPGEWCKGYHVVKVLIADGQFSTSGAFDELQDPSKHGMVSYVWAVNTSACSNGVGQCSP